MRDKLVSSVILLTLLGAGCQDSSRSDSFADVEASTVLLTINGLAITKADWQTERNLRLGMFELSSAPSDYTNGLANARASLDRGLLNALVSRKVVYAYALSQVATGTVAYASIFGALQATNQNQVIVMGGSTNRMTIGQLLTRVRPELRACYLAGNREELAFETYLRLAYTNCLPMTAADVKRGLANLARYNAEVDMTNTLHYALATNVWKRAQAGEDFATLADKYSQDPDRQPGGALGELVENELSDEEGLWERLNGLKVGETTPPVDTSMGIEVYHLDKRLSESESNSGETALVVSRIFLRKGLAIAPMTPAEFKAQAERLNHDEAVKRETIKAWKAVKIEFPNGRQILPANTLQETIDNLKNEAVR